jgi:hypothetical protein
MGIVKAFGDLAVNTVGISLAEGEERAALDENRQQLSKAAMRSDALAVDALRRGSFLGGLKRMEGSRTIAQQKVAYEASGVDSTVGTAAQVAGATRLVSELDAQTLQNNAAREALGHTTTADQYRADWTRVQREAENRRTQRGMEWGGKALSFLGAGLGGGT